jgi:hypothetical protein
LWYGEPDASGNVIDYTKHRSRSRDAVIRVYDEAGKVIGTHAHAGDGSWQSSKRTRRSVVNATYSDATGAILTRLFGGFAPDFPHYISGKEFKK